ncbi:collagenase-like [Lucilia sericata]|uniref:collagenase-like n=1 Tax=Lucilia sericata TaxID=13632 RepID=UPI0018A8127F|nr:collagenase-like [Lucilia sericata]
MNTFFYIVSLLWILCQLQVIPIQTTDYPNYQSAAIISGRQAVLGQFPWHVLIRRDNFDTLLCGGSIIANKWVLTAAHCLNDLDSVRLEFGTVNLYVDGLIKKATRFHIHPKFDRKHKTDDIALIELLTPLNFNEEIKAIDLVSSAQASNDFVGAEAVLTGFGQTANIAEDFSEFLLWASVEVITNTACAQAYHRASIANEEMCAIGYMGSDMSPCDGDSGGALVWKNEFNKFVQIGVASFTVSNRCTEFPAGYARVSSYLDYIHNITGLTFDLPNFK